MLSEMLKGCYEVGSPLSPKAAKPVTRAEPQNKDHLSSQFAACERSSIYWMQRTCMHIHADTILYTLYINQTAHKDPRCCTWDINQHCFHTQERMHTGVHSTTEKKKKKHFEARQINRTVPLRGKSSRSLQYFPYFSLPTCNQTAYCKKFKDGRNETHAATIHKHARSTVLLCLHCSPYSHLLITVLIRWL